MDSPPLQQFLIRLIGYIRTAKGKSQNPPNKRRRSRSSSAKQAPNVDQTQRPKSNADFSSPHRDSDCVRSSSISESLDLKDELHKHNGSLNSDNRATDVSQSWNFNSHPFSHETQNLDRTHHSSKYELHSSDGRNIDMNRPTTHNAELWADELKKDNSYRGGMMHKHPSSKYVDPCAHPQAFTNRGSQQLEPWQEARYSRENDGNSPRSQVAEQESLANGKWKHKIFDNSQQANNTWGSSPLPGNKEPDWSGFRAAMMRDKTQDISTTSGQDSVPGTPRVYLDRDVDQAAEGENSLTAFSPVPGDECLKSILSRPLKVQTIDTPQFVKDDGSVWQGFQHSRNEVDREEKFSLTPKINLEKNSENSIGSRKMLDSQKCLRDPGGNPTDLSFKPDSRGFNNPVKTSDSKSINYLGSVPGKMSSAPATLVYAGSGNGQSHPLGTPVFLYPAGSYPTADNSLASLPSLVQNIVYNQSGAPLLQPVADRYSISAASKTYGSALTMVGKVPVTCASGPSTYVPLYLPGSSKLETEYTKPSHMISSLAATKSGDPNSRKKSVSNEMPHTPSNAMPSSTRSYQEWTSGSLAQVFSSSASKDVAFNRSPHFKITDVRSCEDADFPNSYFKGGSNFTATQSGWQKDKKNYSSPNKTVLSECQGLSGCKVNIFADLKDSASTSKNVFFAEYNNNNNRQTQVGLSNSKHSGPQAGHKNSSKHVPSGNSSKQTQSGYSSSSENERGDERKWESRQTAMKGKANQAVQHQKSTSLTRKRQSSGTDCDRLSNSSHTEETRLKSSVEDSRDSVKAPRSQEKSSQKLRSQPRTDSDNSYSDQEGKATPMSKLRDSAAPSSSNYRSSSRRHICQSCELEFPSGTDLLLHRYEQHSLVCGECDSRFLSSSGLQRHKETDHPPISRCPHCRFATFSRDGLASHIASEHAAGLEENAKVSSDKLHKNETPSDSSMVENQTRENSGQIDLVANIDASLDSHRDSQSSTYTHSLSTSEQEKKNLQANSENLCGKLEANNLAYGTGTDVETTASELEEPSLVIDTSDQDEFNKKDTEGDQPLCLVVHSRESERAEQSTTLTKEQEKLTQKEPMCEVNPVSREKIEREAAGDNSLICNSRTEENDHLNSSSEGVSLQTSHIRRESRIPSKRKFEFFGDKIDIEIDSGSTPCIAYRQYSMEYEGLNRDVWSTVQSGEVGKPIETDHPTTKSSDGSEPDHASATSGIEATKNFQPKRARSVSIPSISDNKPPQLVNESSGQNGSRELALHDRHTLSSLPPKKRGFRKSPRQSSGSANTSVITRTLRGANGQERTTGTHQVQPKLSQNSKPKLELDFDGKQSTSSSAESGQGAKDKEASSAILGLSAFHASKVLRKKNGLSSSSHRRHQKRHKNQSCETTVSRNGELKSSKEQIQESSTSATTTAHLTKNPVKSHKCSAPGCSATFSRKWTMEVHLDHVHRKDGRQFTCHVPLCSGKFTSRRELRKHVVEGHQGKIRRYTCSWPDCGKSFFARTHLRTHTLVHTGEKPVACHLCDYRCRQRTALIWHMRKHGDYSGQLKESVKGSISGTKRDAV
ncbi:zinc finger protein 653 [Elysia marginata]|uniref:Zinc finger protein 653 n=1 Tax=Elysia marginata TaxID=1093978 RepID=A0AAV4F209_9GAST|nr:zinc finger protein 653 [Elysia marginata]